MGAIAKEAVLKRNGKEKDFCIIVNFLYQNENGREKILYNCCKFFKIRMK